MISPASSFLLLLASLAMAQGGCGRQQRPSRRHALSWLVYPLLRTAGVRQIFPDEVFTNYRDALMKAGYQSLFSCEGPSCGFAMYWQNFNGLYASGGPRDVRFLTVRGRRGERDVTIAMSVNTAQSILHIVEQRSMETGLVTASAAELAAGIVRDGHINVYAIYFDTGKAALKPESGPA